MSLKKDTGIVLKARLFSDSDIILTLLGETGPKARYMVKGIKKSRRRPIVACEQGAYIQIDYYHHINREIYNIKELYVINRFENAKKGYTGFLLISYLCDLVHSFLPDGDLYSRCFKILYSAFMFLESDQYSPVLLPFFKTRLLYEIGLLSNELNCHFCNKPVLELDSAFLESWNFEITCSDCQNISINHISMIRLLNLFFQSKYKDLIRLELLIDSIIELDRALNHYIQAYLNQNIKSHSILYEALGKNYEINY